METETTLCFSNFKDLNFIGSFIEVHLSGLSPGMIPSFSSSGVEHRSLHFPNLSSDFVAGRPETSL